MLRYDDAIGLGTLLRMPVLHGMLGLLLAVDLLFLGLHAAHVMAEWQGGSRFVDRRWSIETEGGAAELWEVGKTGLCVAALADSGRRAGQPVYAALAFGFGLALADNLFALHERGGAWLAVGLAEAGRLFQSAPQALGETVVFALDGLLIGAVLWAGFRRSARHHWPPAAAMALLLVALAAFGVGLDLLHAALGGLRRAVDRGLGTLEDGGELVLLSLAAAFAVALDRHLAMRAVPQRA